MTERLPFIDAHVHLWDLSHVRYPWLMPPFAEDGPNGSVEPIARDYGLDDYLADAGSWDVRGIVHIDAGAEAADALKETDWLQATADARGMPNAIVAFAALDDPKVEALLAAHAERRSVRGIRHIVNWHPDPARTYTPRDVTGDPAWAAGFAVYTAAAQPPALVDHFSWIADAPLWMTKAGGTLPSFAISFGLYLALRLAASRLTASPGLRDVPADEPGL